MTYTSDMNGVGEVNLGTGNIPRKERRMDNEIKMPEKGLFAIDKQHLDTEWVNQATTSFEVGEMAAKARLRYDEMRRVYDVLYAELSLDVRRNPAKYGFTTKPTEAAIESALSSNSNIIGAQRAIQEAKYNLDLCTAAVTAVENKKKALESLTQLKAMNYYASK